ncbi:Gfo/Idh/MocA family oxidoreductase [Tardiphaga sp. 42S5]|uniref:Gfo/Idh/MocA family protein n=1 Tax=Tardiphaga sp. 42S5 TaxID=1404799 RepID=UPI002A5A8FC2|nr:Gfo/Idh/MocA family oxidoreductase [Tardiphaga sp. 42S5]WPO44300.1 Gfo/Idh/MocA family oxidoreductase [Tardiphaga sp. 42S5]
MSGIASAPGVAIIGCGLIGHKRAKALGNARLVVCADIAQDRADRLAATAPGCRAVTDWQQAVADPEVSIVMIATLHDTLAEIAHGAVAAGKHVLIEKPAARNAAELAGLAEAAAAKGCLVRVGFNHRYHRALQKAYQLVTSGELGPLMFLRARYGHGGRVGYDREWRSDPKKSGGGELIDQGPHLVDLARWFLGDFAEVDGFAATYYWDMPVDDNGFLLLKTVERKVAFLHASCTEWKNTFSFEIYGRDGKIDINGLGGSYGTERLTFYKMLPEMGPPETTSWEYPMADNSWDVEFDEFLEDIRLKRQPAAGIRDAVEALHIIEKIYRMSGYDHNA